MPTPPASPSLPGSRPLTLRPAETPTGNPPSGVTRPGGRDLPLSPGVQRPVGAQGARSRSASPVGPQRVGTGSPPPPDDGELRFGAAFVRIAARALPYADFAMPTEGVDAEIHASFKTLCGCAETTGKVLATAVNRSLNSKQKHKAAETLDALREDWTKGLAALKPQDLVTKETADLYLRKLCLLVQATVDRLPGPRTAGKIEFVREVHERVAIDTQVFLRMGLDRSFLRDMEQSVTAAMRERAASPDAATAHAARARIRQLVEPAAPTFWIDLAARTLARLVGAADSPGEPRIMNVNWGRDVLRLPTGKTAARRREMLAAIDHFLVPNWVANDSSQVSGRLPAIPADPVDDPGIEPHDDLQPTALIHHVRRNDAVAESHLEAIKAVLLSEAPPEIRARRLAASFPVLQQVSINMNDMICFFGYAPAEGDDAVTSRKLLDQLQDRKDAIDRNLEWIAEELEAAGPVPVGPGPAVGPSSGPSAAAPSSPPPGTPPSPPSRRLGPLDDAIELSGASDTESASDTETVAPSRALRPGEPLRLSEFGDREHRRDWFRTMASWLPVLASGTATPASAVQDASATDLRQDAWTLRRNASVRDIGDYRTLPLTQARTKLLLGKLRTCIGHADHMNAVILSADKSQALAAQDRPKNLDALRRFIARAAMLEPLLQRKTAYAIPVRDIFEKGCADTAYPLNTPEKGITVVDTTRFGPIVRHRLDQCAVDGGGWLKECGVDAAALGLPADDLVYTPDLWAVHSHIEFGDGPVPPLDEIDPLALRPDDLSGVSVKVGELEGTLGGAKAGRGILQRFPGDVSQNRIAIDLIQANRDKVARPGLSARAGGPATPAVWPAATR